MWARCGKHLTSTKTIHFWINSAVKQFSLSAFCNSCQKVKWFSVSPYNGYYHQSQLGSFLFSFFFRCCCSFTVFQCGSSDGVLAERCTQLITIWIDNDDTKYYYESRVHSISPFHRFCRCLCIVYYPLCVVNIYMEWGL